MESARLVGGSESDRGTNGDSRRGRRAQFDDGWAKDDGYDWRDAPWCYTGHIPDDRARRQFTYDDAVDGWFGSDYYPHRSSFDNVEVFRDAIDGSGLANTDGDDLTCGIYAIWFDRLEYYESRHYKWGHDESRHDANGLIQQRFDQQRFDQ